MYALSNISVANRILGEPKRLWDVRAPDFTDRPADTAGTAAAIGGGKTASDVLRSMAKGWRPRSDQKYTELEYSATIMGGIRALRAAGVWPWTGVITDNLPTLYFTKAQARENVLEQLTALAAQGARYLGDHPPTSGFLATEYIRKQVADSKLQMPAWALRGMILVGEAYTNQQVRSQVESTAGSVASVAGKLIAPIPVVGWILGPLLSIAGDISSVSAGRTKVEAARSKGDINNFIQMYEHGMADVLAQAKLAAAQNQLDVTLRATELARESAVLDGEKRGKAIANAAIVGSGVLFVGAVGISAGFIIKRLRQRRKK